MKLVTSRPVPSEDSQCLKRSPDDILVANGNVFQLRVSDAPRTLSHVLEWAAARDLTLEHIEVVPATLEDVFLELTGKNLRD